MRVEGHREPMARDELCCLFEVLGQQAPLAVIEGDG
jgi:hypothetical protein